MLNKNIFYHTYKWTYSKQMCKKTDQLTGDTLLIHGPKLQEQPVTKPETASKNTLLEL